MKGLKALITGSTSGIGLGIAECFAASGADVFLNGFGNADEITKIQNTIKSHGVNTAYSNADVSKPEQIEILIEQALQTFGRIDVLVNNAGIQYVSPIEDFSVDKWDEVIAVNLSAAFHTMRLLLPKMKQRNFGRIINIASAHALVASPNKSAYVAAKHGLAGLTKTAALETADYNITVNALCPGWVDTPLVRRQIEQRAAKSGLSIENEATNLLAEKQPKKIFTTPANVGAFAVFLCGEDANTITGSCLGMDGGWTAW